MIFPHLYIFWLKMLFGFPQTCMGILFSVDASILLLHYVIVHEISQFVRL